MPGKRFQSGRLILFAHGCACVVAVVTLFFTTEGSLLALLPVPLLPAAPPAGGATALAALVLCLVCGPDWLTPATLPLALCLAFCVPIAMAGAAKRALRGRVAAAPAWTGRLRAPLFTAAAVLLLLTVHRAFPLYELLAFAAAYAASAWNLPRRAGKERTRWRTALANGLLLIVSVTLTLGAGEIAFRMVFGGPRPVHTVSHPERIWMPGPYATRVREFRDPVFGHLLFEYRYGAQGLRRRDYGPKPPGVCRVLLLGDSFTFGDGLEWEQTYGMLLENLLNEAAGGPRFEVVNAGVPGYGPAQELSLLREMGFALEPDIVVLQMLLDNDIGDDLALVGKHMEAFNAEDVAARIFRHRGSGGWLVRVHQALRGRLALYSILWRTNPDFGILYSAANLRFFPVSRFPALAKPADRPWHLEVLLREWPPILDEGWDLCREHVRAMRSECEARGVGFAAFTVPASSSVSDTIWQNTLPNPEHRERYERGKEVRVVEAFFGAEGIPHASLLEPLLTHAKDEYLYYAWDGHFTPRGAEVTARVLFDFLWPRLPEWCGEAGE